MSAYFQNFNNYTAVLQPLQNYGAEYFENLIDVDNLIMYTDQLGEFVREKHEAWCFNQTSCFDSSVVFGDTDNYVDDIAIISKQLVCCVQLDSINVYWKMIFVTFSIVLVSMFWIKMYQFCCSRRQSHVQQREGDLVSSTSSVVATKPVTKTLYVPTEPIHEEYDRDQTQQQQQQQQQQSTNQKSMDSTTTKSIQSDTIALRTANIHGNDTPVRNDNARFEARRSLPAHETQGFRRELQEHFDRQNEQQVFESQRATEDPPSTLSPSGWQQVPQHKNIIICDTSANDCETLSATCVNAKVTPTRDQGMGDSISDPNQRKLSLPSDDSKSKTLRTKSSQDRSYESPTPSNERKRSSSSDDEQASSSKRRKSIISRNESMKPNRLAFGNDSPGTKTEIIDLSSNSDVEMESDTDDEDVVMRSS